MCVGISLTFLSTYFSFAYPEYVDSIFFMVDIILLMSVVFLLLFGGGVKRFVSKIILMAAFFILAYFGLSILGSIFFLTSFGRVLINVFSVFSMMCSLTLMLIASFIVKDSLIFRNRNYLILIFSPLIIFSLSILAVNSFLQDFDTLSSTGMHLFLLSFSIIYSAFIFYNFAVSSVNVLPLKNKFLLVSSGMALILLSAGFREADFLFKLSSLLSVIGCFILCFGLLTESSLKLHEAMLNKLINNLKDKKRGSFISYLKRVIGRAEGLKYEFTDSGIALRDSPALSNHDEKNEYDRIILFAYKWYRKHAKGESGFLAGLKNFYNNQAVMVKRLDLFLI